MASSSSRTGFDRRDSGRWDSDRRDADRRESDRRESHRWEPHRRTSNSYRRDPDGRDQSRFRERDWATERDRDRDNRPHDSRLYARGRDRDDDRDQHRNRDGSRPNHRDSDRGRRLDERFSARRNANVQTVARAAELPSDDNTRDVRRPVSDKASSPPTVKAASVPPSARNDAALSRNSPATEASLSIRQQVRGPAKDPATPAVPLDHCVQRIVEILCQRVFWFMQREKADTTYKKTKSDVDRCKNSISEYSSAYNILTDQEKIASDVRKKCCDKVELMDQKMQAALPSVLSAIRREIQQAASQPGTLGPEPERTTGLSRSEFESDLAALNAKIEELQAQNLAEKSRNDVLEQQILAERARSNSLEQRLDALSQKVAQIDADAQAKQQKPDDELKDEIAAKMSEAAKNLITRDQLNQALQELDMRISTTHGVESGQSSLLDASAGQRTKGKLSSIEKFVDGLCSATPHASPDELPSCIRSLMASVAAQDRATHEQMELQKETRSAIASLKDSVTKIEVDLSSTEQLRQLVRAMPTGKALEELILTTTKAPVHGLFHKFGLLIDGEREQREAGALIHKKTAADLAVLKKEHETLTKQQKERHSRQDSELASWGEKLVSLQSSLTAVRDDVNDHHDELELQIKSVQTWQNNFTTQRLYEDIVSHINALVPNGVGAITDLTIRVEAIEGRLGSEHPHRLKRRKTDHEGPVPANGHATT
ncbi:Deoxyribonuclease Tat-D [Purpureocillium lavendulum]|uniref:Deoxyribonuclease Tat-D n=1 Tax=Purpureocillium lavendulum TaxID=1247861 RepID=A0AB34FV73_9HYPO|nr:Deoxyribonuclease Tat-D [Purpureocillium lavendulum]